MPEVKGTHDLLGDDIKKINFLESRAREFFSELGFEEIRTPVIEYSHVFRKSLGESSDVVMHEMYVFEDKDGSEIVLRPEGTAPVVRAYIEKIRGKSPRAKLFYVGPMFRRERPQKGRYRQFHQIGCEMLGFDSPESDAFLIFVLSRFLKSVKVKHEVKINSVGCPECRPKYAEEVRRFFSGKIDSLCDDCKKRLGRNPLRIIDCKKDRDIITLWEGETPKIHDFLCPSCKEKFDKVKRVLELLSVDFSEDPYIVRGLDYYTGVVFEIFHPSDEKNAIAAGGRYDNLVEVLGGPPTPAVGFAMGEERVAQFIETEQEKREGLFIIYTEEGKEKAFSLLKEIVDARSEGKLGLPSRVLRNMKVDISVEPQKSIKAQLRYADSRKFEFVFIIGKNEVEEGTITLRDLAKSEQFKIRGIDEFAEYILKMAQLRDFPEIFS